METQQKVVETGDLLPIRFLRGFGVGVHGRNGGLQGIDSHGSVTQGGFRASDTFANLVLVPTCAVLLFKEHEFSGRADASHAARVLKQHEAEKCAGLRLAGQQVAKQARKTDRIGTKFPSDERVSGTCQVALIENEI